jgi:hypothetical protein
MDEGHVAIAHEAEKDLHGFSVERSRDDFVALQSRLLLRMVLGVDVGRHA